MFFFFFSSRRRHTSSLCDWSSDVCSSDLMGCPRRLPRCCRSTRPPRPIAPSASAISSEERRVGKKCRSRWLPNHSKKKGCKHHQTLWKHSLWLDPDVNKYELHHRVVHHSKMSEVDYYQTYLDCWRAFFFFKQKTAYEITV